jgi:hypothetical protein
MRPIIIVLTTIATLATAAVADARPLARTCDGVIHSRDGAPIGVTIHRGTITCAKAKRILRAYLNSTRRCEGNGCVREHSGWTCIAASASQLPRVATCTLGRNLIRAYAIFD